MTEHGETGPDRENPVIDPKDVVLHLRAIHFSLLVACVGLYVLVTAGRPEEINLARSQLAEIVAVTERWQPGWVESAARDMRNPSTELKTPSDHAAGPIGLSIDQPWTLLPLQQGLLDLANPGAKIDPLDPEGPLWSALAEPERRDAQFLPVPRTEFVPAVFPLNLPAPQTLKEFESHWNALGRITLTLTEASWVFPDTMGPKAGELGRLPYSEARNANGLNVVMRLEPIADAQQEAVWRDRVEHEWDPKYHFVGHIDLAANEIASLLPGSTRAQEGSPQPLDTPGLSRAPQPATITMAAQVDTGAFDAQAAFIEHFGLGWQAGSYALNFPELSAVAAGNDDLYFDKVTAFIESRARQSEGEIALFGFTVPVAMVSSWGLPILLVAQIYFLLHLRSLRQCLLTNARPKLAPWIGVYDDRFARAITVASAFVLPPVTVAVVIAPDVASSPAWAVAVVTSGVLGLVSFAILRKVWTALGNGR